VSRFLITPAVALSAAAVSATGAATSYPPYIITFASGETRPDAVAWEVIAKVVNEYQKGNGGAALTVSGHTDRLGSIDANQRLACARARTVRARLMSHGIPGNRIFIEGFGELRPTVETADEVAAPANRRVEIAVVPFPWRASTPAAIACR
jgi:outer membrane protein OmpA-like peptidoglycan-associated protein